MCSVYWPYLVDSIVHAVEAWYFHRPYLTYDWLDIYVLFKANHPGAKVWILE